MRRIVDLYAGWLAKAPLVTKCITSGILFGTGDRIAQRLERHDAEAEGNEARLAQLSGRESVTRTLRMMAWSGFCYAPMAHNWYNLVDRTVRATGALAIAQKIALDQLLFTPFILTAFYTVTQYMESKPPREAFSFAIEKLPPTLETSYRLWPFVHLATFTVIPLQYRVLFINCVSLGWSTFLSGMSNQSNSKQEDGDAEVDAQRKALVLTHKSIE